jgi:membrane protein DedA with SNARE-associated domain/rhodanese-related sulfurtransferase
MMAYLSNLIEQYGLAVVFANVLIEQLGAPIPAYPTLVITGALAGSATYSLSVLLATAVVAALIADLAWFLIGRRYGRKVMAILCRISLSPDSCVRQTESVYSRWGAPSLVIAKFIPGFASVASALAGTLGAPLGAAAFFDILGTTLWAGSAIYLGSLFNGAVDELLATLNQLGQWGVALIVVAFGLFLASKWWQRYRFLKELRMARISVDELYELQQHGTAPTIVDVRPAFSLQGGRIPGAVVLSTQALSGIVDGIPAGAEVVVYCACPNDASAARVAKQLMRIGHKRVRPLAGGIDAWIAAGYSVEA